MVKAIIVKKYPAKKWQNARNHGTVLNVELMDFAATKKPVADDKDTI